MPSTTNDRYELIERLPVTEGDSATAVYKARIVGSASTDGDGGLVLLRLTPPGTDSALLQAASDQALTVPNHPNILHFEGLANLTALDNLEPGIYLVNEYVRGISLRERIRRVAPFSLGISLDIAIAVGQALIAANSVDMIHGDLNPEHILLTPDGRVKVADFAIARVIDARMGMRLFTHTDIRALGLIIYEMLTGVAPDQIDQVDQHSPRTLNPNVPSALDGIVQKATSLNEQRQYPNTARMLVDLQTARDDLRGGKPLTWSPLAEQTKTPARPVARGPLTKAADELLKEREQKPRTQPMAKTEDLDQEDGSYPGIGRVNIVLLVMLALLVVGIIAAVAYGFTIFSVPADIVVPNLIGKQYTDAQKLADGQHFNLVEERHDYSDAWPSGAVYEMNPAPGRMIKAGKEVDVSVSDGPRLVTTPDVGQMTLDKARHTVEDSDLSVGNISYEYNDSVDKGIVINQTPTPSSNIPHQSLVSLVVSKGPNPPIAPTGLTATATVNNEIDLQWNEVDNAVAYDVYRDGKKLQQGLPQAAYSDVNLGDGETHKYTVTAVNANGESPQSPPMSATTLINGLPPTSTTTAPVAPPPSAISPDTSTPSGSPHQRRFEIRFRVPGSDQHNVQIEVQDTTGTNIVYDENEFGGDVVDTDVSGFGNKVILRIFVDGKLVRQQTK